MRTLYLWLKRYQYCEKNFDAVVILKYSVVAQANGFTSLLDRSFDCDMIILK
jgi:hypothetical protein